MKYVMRQRLAHSTHAMDVIISVHVLLLMVHTNMYFCYAFIYVCMCVCYFSEIILLPDKACMEVIHS